MKFSRIIMALLTAGIVAISSIGAAQALEPYKGPLLQTQKFVTKVSHHGKCYKWKYYGVHKHCYKYRYKSCYKWKYDAYGTKYCFKSKWKYYYKKFKGYHKGHHKGYHYNGGSY